jgi:hypothetical protein
MIMSSLLRSDGYHDNENSDKLEYTWAQNIIYETFNSRIFTIYWIMHVESLPYLITGNMISMMIEPL